MHRFVCILHLNNAHTHTCARVRAHTHNCIAICTGLVPCSSLLLSLESSTYQLFREFSLRNHYLCKTSCLFYTSYSSVLYNNNLLCYVAIGIYKYTNIAMFCITTCVLQLTELIFILQHQISLHNMI